MTTIETLSQWAPYAAKLRAENYKRWRWQYSFDNPEGLRVWFWAADKETIEFVTHTYEIQRAMLDY